MLGKEQRVQQQLESLLIESGGGGGGEGGATNCSRIPFLLLVSLSKKHFGRFKHNSSDHQVIL